MSRGTAIALAITVAVFTAIGVAVYHVDSAPIRRRLVPLPSPTGHAWITPASPAP